jgi:hypothetical protein
MLKACHNAIRPALSPPVIAQGSQVSVRGAAICPPFSNSLFEVFGLVFTLFV